MAKEKQQGHYCKICGEHKANEKFTGKGHALHICKACMSAIKSGKKIEVDTKNGEDPECYGLGYEPDDSLPIISEKKSFKKLKQDEKAVLKVFISDIVTEYWQSNRQIPVGEDFAAINGLLLGAFAEECHLSLKDDVEFKNYLNANIISVLNKLLKTEKQEQDK